MRSLNRLKWLHAFEATARHGSFTGAAQELGVTPAAVGQLVRSLEEWVGHPLLHRTRSGKERLNHHLKFLFLGVDLFDYTRETAERSKSNLHTLANIELDIQILLLFLQLVNRT